MFSKLFNRSHKTAPEKPHAPKEYRRFNDAILVIQQDNLYNKLPVVACNERAIKLIGYSEKEINSLDLRELLPIETREIVDDYIEFADDGKGVDEVLLKIANFRLLGSRGRLVPVKLRVITGLSTFENTTYQLVMADASLLEALEKARSDYASKHGGIIYDLKTGLQTKEDVYNEMLVVIDHGKQYSYESCFAVIDFFDDVSHMKRAGKMLEVAKRDSDIVGLLNDSTLIFVMPDTPLNSTKIPIERFKASLPEDLKSKLAIRCAKIEIDKPVDIMVKDLLDGKTGMTL